MLSIPHPVVAVTREKNHALTYQSLVLRGVPIKVALHAVSQFHALEAALALPRASEVGLEAAIKATMEFARALRVEVEGRALPQSL